MSETGTLSAQSDHLKSLLDEKFGLAKGTLAQRLRRLGRRVPSRVRRDIAVLVEAEANTGHPKLLRMQNHAAIAAAYARAVAHLERIDVADRRRAKLLHLTADLMMKVLVVIALFLAVLYWRGFIGG